MKSLLPTTFACLAVASIALAADAIGGTEVCVSCAEPAKVYRCSIDASVAPAHADLAEKALPRVCPAAIRKLKSHKSCAVSPRTSGAACEGVALRLDADALRSMLASEGAEETAVPGVGQQVGNAFENAGNSVVAALKKSWQCVSSLLKECE